MDLQLLAAPAAVHWFSNLDLYCGFALDLEDNFIANRGQPSAFLHSFEDDDFSPPVSWFAVDLRIKFICVKSIDISNY
jgi:hypothetical protein